MLLPARFAHAGDHPRERELAEANAAEAEATQVRARPAAASAAVVFPHLELRLPLALLDHGLTCHSILLCVIPHAPSACRDLLSRTRSRPARPTAFRPSCLPSGTACPVPSTRRAPCHPAVPT